ncbi:MAG TPA: Gfo/Idh/MocA family oxidoreductase [Fimbriimonadaceae bacterium]|nr:Gfo/Idh/MocA family oxidoreductase [Fimbriimonadaceae bacterium]
MRKVGVGVVGCGNIAPIYLQNLSSFDETAVVAVADIKPERAKARAEEFGVKKATDLKGLLDDPDVEVVLNLTTPPSHFSVAKAALEAGRHVYNEKPLTIDVREADELLATSSDRGLLVGCAPDTFLGAGIQTCRELIDHGAIGEPLAFNAFMMCPGHEGWHPDPAFYYDFGGGPLFDMGPYYLTALVALLGPVARVCGAKKKSFETRTIGSEPKRGEQIDVKVPTHLVTVMEFAGGAVGQLTTSFDVKHHTLPHIEVYGSKGTLGVPDPNGFDGKVRLRSAGDDDWKEVPLARPYAQNSRGLGVRDLVQAAEEGREPRASGALARHVLQVIHATHAAPHRGEYVEIEGVERPEAMPSD